MSQPETKATKRILVTSKSILLLAIPVSLLTIFSIWFWGLGEHRTLFENSILSTSILSIAFFLFLTIGLYNGIKLKDDLGKITDRINIENTSHLPNVDGSPDDLDVSGGIYRLASVFDIPFNFYLASQRNSLDNGISICSHALLDIFSGIAACLQKF
jgi:hypothetical protein